MKDNISSKLNTISIFIAVAVIATASFDIFLSFEMAGFSFRIAQFLAVGLYLLAFLIIGRTKKVQRVYAWQPLVICFAALVIATFNSRWYIRNIAYNLWMISLVMIVWSFVQLFTNENVMRMLLKAYLITFNLMAIFGLVQFLLAFFGITEFYLRQWLIYGVIPRINGFSYEPSYYATYMVMGWAFCAGLLKEGIYRWQGISIRLSFLLLSLSLVFSSSRMVYICFFSWTLFYLITWVIERIQKKKVTREALLELVLQMSVWCIVALYCLFIAVFGIAAPSVPSEGKQSSNVSTQQMETSVEDIMLQGLGAKEDTRNMDERLLAWKYTFKVFLKSPVLGCGLGAVTDEARLIADPEPNPLGSGNVLLEIFAAGGIVSGVAAIIYVFCLLWPGWKQMSLHTEFYTVSRALGYGLIGILLLLMFNATILRVYLWVHIALLTTWNRVWKENEINNETS